MIWLYRLLFLPALLVLAPYYLWRMRRRGGYGAGFMQRFGADPGLPPKTPGRPRVWLQAVSVGEMLAVAPILEALRRDGAEVYLTTTTSTGHKLARERHAALAAGVGYFPLDAWPCVARAWRRIAPDLLILAEGERWPEHLRAAAARGVPVLNINARLSDRSFARLKKFPRAAALTFRGITRLLAVSADDAERFVACGMPRERVAVTGNIKLDVAIPPLAAAERAQLRRELGLPDGDRVLLGASTWPGEERALVAALREARAAGLRCALLLVPRHAERRAEIEAELGATGLRFHLRSRGAAPGEVDVAVADTTGELRRLTQLADVAFVGKTLPPHTEGQTPVEAAALGKPILFGPGTGNFRAITRELIARGAAREVADAGALAGAATALLADEGERARLADAARQWHLGNAGAAARTAAVIHGELTRPA
jgi:3-deoxy-D-manno-octulosonic-acid transferase